MITLAYTTARMSPRFDWLFASLSMNGGREDISQILIVDRFAEAYDSWSQDDVDKRRNDVMREAGKNNFIRQLQHVAPKPNVWSGRHRLTPRDWWSKPSDLNTAYAYCRNDYIALIDDRCVLSNTSLDAIRQAKQEGYGICGTYRKYEHMEVDDKSVVTGGKVIGEDDRAKMVKGSKLLCPGTWMYGHAIALPIEWVLQVNGCDESWCSVSMEDTHFGQMLTSNNFPLYHDPRFATWQDRTNCDHDMKRSSKEKYPHDKNDKTHQLILKLWGNKQAVNTFELRKLRASILNGGSFPIPTEPTADWFDGQPLREMW